MKNLLMTALCGISFNLYPMLKTVSPTESLKITGVVMAASLGYSLTHAAVGAHFNPKYFKNTLKREQYDPMLNQFSHISYLKPMYNFFSTIKSPTAIAFISSLKTTLLYGLSIGASTAVMAQLPLSSAQPMSASALIKPGAITFGVIAAAAGIGAAYGYSIGANRKIEKYKKQIVEDNKKGEEKQREYNPTSEKLRALKKDFASAYANDVAFGTALISGLGFLTYIGLKRTGNLF